MSDGTGTETGTGAPPVPLRRNRDLVLWWTGSSVSRPGTGIASIAFPLLVLGATGSAAQTAIVGIGWYLAKILLSLPAWVVADRYSRRRILVLVPLAGAVAVGTVTVAVLAGRVSIVTSRWSGLCASCRTPTR